MTAKVMRSNKGFKMSTGDIIGWINSDDALTPGALKYISEYYSNNPDTEIVVGDLQVIDDQNRQIEVKKGKPLNFSYLLNHSDGVIQPSTFFKRRLFKKTGYLDVSLSYCMDLDFFYGWPRLQILNIFRKYYHSLDCREAQKQLITFQAFKRSSRN